MSDPRQGSQFSPLDQPQAHIHTKFPNPSSLLRSSWQHPPPQTFNTCPKSPDNHAHSPPSHSTLSEAARNNSFSVMIFFSGPLPCDDYVPTRPCIFLITPAAPSLPSFAFLSSRRPPRGEQANAVNSILLAFCISLFRFHFVILVLSSVSYFPSETLSLGH